MRHFTELKKDTIFVNVSSGEVKIGEFRRYEVQSYLLGSCLNVTTLYKSIHNWLQTRKKWRFHTSSVCYTFDPPFTIDHTSTFRKGIVLDVHNMIHDLIGIKPIFKKVFLNEKGRRRKMEKKLENVMKSRYCDYFIQGANGRIENLYDFTTPSVTDSLGWYAPIADLAPKWKYVYHILTVQVWCFWILTIVGLFLFWYSTKKGLKTSNCDCKFLEMIWKFFKLVLEQDISFDPKTVTELILISALILESFIMNVAYKCKFIQFLSDDKYENQLNSLEDVMNHDLKIGFIPILSDLFEHDEKFRLYLKNNFVACDFSFACINRTANEKDMIVLRARTKMLYTVKRFTDTNGKYKLKRIGGVVNAMTFNSIFRRGHPLYPLVDKGLLNLQAHGFVHRIIEDYVGITSNVEEPRMNQTLNMRHLRLSFSILLIGLALAGFLFFYEMISVKYID